MIYAVDPDKPRRARPGRKLCPHCGATPGGCNGLHFMAGRNCCDACSGSHDGDGGTPDAA